MRRGFRSSSATQMLLLSFWLFAFSSSYQSVSDAYSLNSGSYVLFSAQGHKSMKCTTPRAHPNYAQAIRMQSDDLSGPISNGKAFVTRSYLDLVLSTAHPSRSSVKKPNKREAIRSALQALWTSFRSIFGGKEPTRTSRKLMTRPRGDLGPGYPPTTRSSTTATRDAAPITTLAPPARTGRVGTGSQTALPPRTAPAAAASAVSPATSRFDSASPPPVPPPQFQAQPAQSDWDDGGAAAARAAESARLAQLMDGYIRRHAGGQTGPAPARGPSKPEGAPPPPPPPWPPPPPPLIFCCCRRRLEEVRVLCGRRRLGELSPRQGTHLP